MGFFILAQLLKVKRFAFTLERIPLKKKKKKSLNIARSWNKLTRGGQVAAATMCLASRDSLPDVPSKSNFSETALIIGF